MDIRSLHPADQKKVRAMMSNFRYFAANCIEIEGKEPGSVYKFVLNAAQEYLFRFILTMLKEKGWVRVIIVKGRQQGISTFIEMFLFWIALFVAHTRVCIISHEVDSSIALFQKVKFAHEMLPDSIRPELGTSNRKELVFPNKSRYLVLTAGSKQSGRSQTAHHQHQSERAYFENAEAIDAGAGQIVADVKGTYVFKESTGNGMNHFYREVKKALKKKGKFRVCFIPWYWSPEYRTKPRKNFKPDADELLLKKLYGLDNYQLQWRRDKIVEFESSPDPVKKFKQEYPNELMEAFQASGDCFYDSLLVRQAMNCKVISAFGPLILSCDPGRSRDRTVIALRRGSQVLKIWKYPHMNEMRLAGIIANMIDDLGVDKAFIDWGQGHGTIDRLHERGYRHIVEGVNFGGISDDPVYADKRAEMNYGFREWLKRPDSKLPKDDDMAADIASMPEPEPDSNGRMRFPSKKDIRKLYGMSPDILDALVLQFAYNVRASENTQPKRVRNVKNGSALTTQRRVRQPEETIEDFDFEESPGIVRKSIKRKRRWGLA